MLSAVLGWLLVGHRTGRNQFFRRAMDRLERTAPLRGVAGWASLPLMQASGIDGGIATGHPIRLRAAFKPTSSIGIGGRHDPCVGIRATPICEAMVALVLMDQALRHRAQCGDVGAKR